jgi:hypothetical protein
MVEVSDGCSTASDIVEIIVYQLDWITLSSSQSLCYGEEADTLHTNYNSGTGEMTFTWQKKVGDDWTTIATNNQDYYAPGVMTENTEYRCIADNSCETLESNNIEIEVGPQLLAYAGEDTLVCYPETTSIDLTAEVSGQVSIQWSTPNGQGTIMNYNNINAAYQISSNDETLGYVTIVLQANGPSSCGTVVYDEMIIEIQSQPGISNFGIESLCEGEDQAYSIEAENYSAIQWQTSGSGTFTNASGLETIYTPSEEDIINGGAFISVTASPINPCEDAITASKALNIYRIPEAPQIPSGPQTVEIYSGWHLSVDYSTNNDPDATIYEWELTPDYVGEFSSTTTHVAIDFQDQGGPFLAQLRVKGDNLACEGSFSEALDIYLGTVETEIPEEERPSMELIPNPTTGKSSIHLQNFTAGHYKLIVTNTISQEVITESIKIQDRGIHYFDIDLSSAAPGMYYVSLVNERGSVVRKLVKE